MAKKVQEVGRRCQRCGYGWFAWPPMKGGAKKPRWHDEMGLFSTDGQAHMTRRTSNYERHLPQVATFAQCPNCGSHQVTTDTGPGFQPTGALTQQIPQFGGQQSAPQQFGTGPGGPNPGHHPGSHPASPEPTFWQKVGVFHAKHWRIIWALFFLIGPLGSITDDTASLPTAKTPPAPRVGSQTPDR